MGVELDVLTAKYYTRFWNFFQKTKKKRDDVFDFKEYDSTYWKVASMYVDIKCRETLEDYRIVHPLLNYYLSRSPRGLVKKLMND